MEVIIFFSAIFGLVIQYLIIKSAVSEALEKHRVRSAPISSANYDNLLIALGYNPNDFARIDQEAEKLFHSKMNELKKTRAYKYGKLSEMKRQEDELKSVVFGEANIKKMEIKRFNNK